MLEGVCPQKIFATEPPALPMHLASLFVYHKKLYSLDPVRAVSFSADAACQCTGTP